LEGVDWINLPQDTDRCGLICTRQ